jgi:hypothetical protein
MVDLYEAVQHAPQLISRLYLLITVGSVYIQSHEDGSHKILEDLIEMLRVSRRVYVGCPKSPTRLVHPLLFLKDVQG